MRAPLLLLTAFVAILLLVPTAVAVAPTITSADITTADGAYNAGDTITIETVYDQTVTVDGGTPTLALNFNTRSATYVGGSGSTTLTWTYTIQAGDNSPDAGASGPGAISLNGGTIQNGAMEDADNTLPNDLTAGSAVVVDTTAPTVSSIVRADADPTNAASVAFTVTFSESVNGIGTGDFALTTTSGDAAGNIASASAASGTTVTVTVDTITGDGGLRLDFTGTVTDDAGNDNTAGFTTGEVYTIDNTAPTVSSIVRADANPTNAASVDFTVTFSESVNGIGTGDFTLDAGGTATGTIASVSAASGTTVTVTVNTISGDGSLSIDFTGTVTDDAGNDNTAGFTGGEAYTIDNTAPTVTVEQKAGQSDPTSTAPILFTATFSEDVTGFTAGDVTVGGTSGGGTAGVSGGPAVYEISITAIAGDGTVTASIGAGVANDAAGNTNTASTSTDNEVTYDTTAPTVTVEQEAGQSDPASSGPILFTATFSEPVTGFTAGDVTVGGTSTGGTASVSGGPAVYEISIGSMTSAGTVTASIGAGVASDGAGNTNAASTSTDNEVTFSPPSGGGGTSSTGSHGYTTGYRSSTSYSQDTQHSLTFGNGAVATIDVTLTGENSIRITVVTRDQAADDLPDGFRSTPVWFDITVSSSSDVASATVQLRPLDPSVLDGDWQDLTVFHETEAGWVEVPTTVEQLEDGTVVVTFTVDSFSPFVLAFDETPEPSTTTTSTTTTTTASETTSPTASPTETPSNQTPVPLWLPVLAIAGAALAVRRRL